MSKTTYGLIGVACAAIARGFIIGFGIVTVLAIVIYWFTKMIETAF
jgi:hypothetical protein